MAPTIQKPTPPVLVQPVDLNLTSLGDAPEPEQVTVPTVTNLQIPEPVGALGKISPKDVSLDPHALRHASCPAPGGALPENIVPVHPEAMGISAPQAPQHLPKVPSVPVKPKTTDKNYGRNSESLTPKTSDIAGALMGLVASALGFLAIVEGKRAKKDK